MYHRQFEERCVCLDETSKQQVKGPAPPLPPRPKCCRPNYEYERNGVRSCCSRLEGWRRVEVTDQRTKVDWALDKWMWLTDSPW